MPKKNKSKKKGDDDWNDEEAEKQLEEKMKKLETGENEAGDKPGKKKVKSLTLYKNDSS